MAGALRTVLGLGGACVLVAALVGPGASAGAQATSGVPHVMVIVFENHEYGQIIGNPDAPYLNSLADDYGLATASYATTHPSLPNYLELVSGSTQGITTDCSSCTADAPQLVDQLDAAGIGWKAYMESMPQPCYTGDSAYPYVKRHDPFVYAPHIVDNPALCDRIVPYSELSTDLEDGTAPPFLWVTPNVLDDMHDGTVAEGDTWLSQQLPMVLDSSWYRNGGIVIITFDEGTTDAGCCEGAQGGHIATIVVSSSTPAGARLATPVDHAGVLRTIEDLYGLGFLGDAADPANGTLLGLLTGGPCEPRPLASPPSGKLTRLAGENRDETAIAVSQEAFPQAQSAHVVVLATDATFPDALAAGPLAADGDGPLLLTTPSALDPATASEIRRVLPAGGSVVIVGGDAAVAPAVAAAIGSMGFSVTRLSGPDRFATAVAVANAIAADVGTPREVYEATGTDFPDGLAASAAAGATDGVVLLTNGSSQAPQTAAWLAAHPGVPRVAVGGPAAAADPSATAVVGPDRFATAVDLANEAFSRPTVLGLASGLSFPDALVGGAEMGRLGGPLLLVPACGPLPASVEGELSGLSGSVGSGYVFGGTSAVGDDVVAEADAALG